MTPPIESFPGSQLIARVQTAPQGKQREWIINLNKCEPMQLTQFRCEVEDSAQGKIIKCKRIIRNFRKCKHDFIVETTELEASLGAIGKSRALL